MLYTGLHAGTVKQFGSEISALFLFFFFSARNLKESCKYIPVERSVLSSTVLTAAGIGDERFTG